MPEATRTAVDIPDKLYFRIGEVSAIVGVPTHVLRFWESEFTALKPRRTGKGQRLYRRKDVELVLKIKHLLYDKRFTIRGAQKHLRGPSDTVAAAKTGSQDAALDQIRRELKAIRALLD